MYGTKLAIGLAGWFNELVRSLLAFGLAGTALAC